MSENKNAERRDQIIAPLTVAECQSLKGPLRQALEMLEEESRRAYEREVLTIANEAERGMFARAAVTSLLSIAAGLLELAAERSRGPLDKSAFEDTARQCAHNVKQRREKLKRQGL